MYNIYPLMHTILTKDVHGDSLEFKHNKRTQKRYILTTGWCMFVNHKKFVEVILYGDINYIFLLCNCYKTAINIDYMIMFVSII